MNTYNKEDIIRKIQKCLAKGDSARNSSEEEVQTALAMAQRLMQEYNIAMTEVQFDSSTQTLKSAIEEYVFGEINNSKWRYILCHVVDILCNTKHFFQTDMRSRKLLFVGIKSDIDIAVEIYKSLCKSVKRLEYSHRGSRQSYSYGVVSRLLDRAKEIKRQESNPVNTTALVVVKDREIRTFLQSKNLSSMKMRRSSVKSDDYNKGYSDGGKINMGREPRQISNTLAIGYK